jgi:hypothetical protein
MRRFSKLGTIDGLGLMGRSLPCLHELRAFTELFETATSRTTCALAGSEGVIGSGEADLLFFKVEVDAIAVCGLLSASS